MLAVTCCVNVASFSKQGEEVQALCERNSKLSLDLSASQAAKAEQERKRGDAESSLDEVSTQLREISAQLKVISTAMLHSTLIYGRSCK